MEYKVGGWVRVEGRLNWHLGKIARVTHKQVILTTGAKYWKETGSRIAAGIWYQEKISPAAEIDIEELKKKRIVEQLVGVDFKKLPLNVLEELLKLASK